MPSISVPTAIIGAGAIGAGATIAATSSAAHAQEKAAQTASNTELNMFNQNKGELQPFIDQGKSAGTTLNDLLGLGSSGNPGQMQSALENIPGYQFTLNQGLKSVQNGATARGLGTSGAALKGAANYSTGLANNTYQGYVGDIQNVFNTGANAANALAGVGTTTATNIGGNQIGAGNAAAGASVAGGNAVAGAANNLSQYYTLRNLLNPANSGGAPSADSFSNFDSFDMGNT